MVGLIGYGTYIPKYRIRTKDVASVWKKDHHVIEQSLGIEEKAVAGIDEVQVSLNGTWRFHPTGKGTALSCAVMRPTAMRLLTATSSRFWSRNTRMVVESRFSKDIWIRVADRLAKAP